ncbi:HGGxSTG domain-containing protein [Paenibacillus sp. S-38]|uniref:HGGxSTG domain-containing protein n=1 Tax=Paenibacillus sp. S-38 TaxID=3416710 RepID=UPI003CEB2C0D
MDAAEKQPHARCGAKTRGGGTCKNGAMENGRCRMHGGKSTGAPKGNKNAVSTGEHEAIWLDALEEDERVFFNSVKIDPLEQINNEIRLLEIRERRMLQRIAKVAGGWESDETQSKQQLVAGADGETLKTTEKTIRKRSKLDRMLSIEDALTRVQNSKTKLLEIKIKLLSSDVQDEELQDDGFLEALRGQVSEVWDDGDQT